MDGARVQQQQTAMTTDSEDWVRSTIFMVSSRSVVCECVFIELKATIMFISFMASLFPPLSLFWSGVTTMAGDFESFLPRLLRD